MIAVESPVVGVKNPPAAEVFERNYETDCPPLYEAIESASNQENFDRIFKFLESGKWDGAFFSTGASPAQQAQTWVTRFDVEDKGKVKWSQLPLHLAIVCGAPCPFIKKLTKLYPQALRCTDDQHMLPLHLALRHGATDEVVAFLLTEFPEGVNAKGKNGRTSVECAQRAKNAVRGVIIGTFVERTKSKISSSVVSERTSLKKMVQALKTETTTLKSELDAQYSVIDKLKRDSGKTMTELERASAEKNNVETDLMRKLQDMENAKHEEGTEAKFLTEKLESAKLIETVELQRKVAKLELEKRKMEEAAEKAEETEASLRKALEGMHERVTKSVSPEDWNNLKKEVNRLQEYRLTNSRKSAKTELKALQADLEKSIKEAKTVDTKNSKLKSELKGELKKITKTVKKLQSDETAVKTTAEMDALREEVKTLRADLKSRAEASKTKVELAVLKKAMEFELASAAGKTQEELSRLKAAVQMANEKDLSSKTAEELARVKSELESVKKEMTEKELLTKTMNDVEDLRKALATEMQKADSKAMGELSELKRGLAILAAKMEDPNSKDEILTVKKEAELLKDELKKMETSTKIQEEAANLKANVEEELQKSQGKTQEELLHMQQAIMALTVKALNNKDADQLAKIKSELGSVKTELKEIEEATKTQVEVVVLKKALEVQLTNATGSNEREIAEMKKAVDAINLENRESKKLKKALAEEIKQVNAKSEKELLHMKKALDKINFTKLETKSKTEWKNLREEMGNLKDELEVKQIVEMSKAEQELLAMKKVVAAINVKEMENKYKDGFGEIRKEMDALREELKVKGDSEATLQKAVADLKAQGQARALEQKKDKAGLKKFLSRRFRKDGTPKQSNTTIEFSASVETTDDMSTLGPPSPSKVSTILPPGLANDFASKKNPFASEDEGSSSSSDDSEYRASIMNSKSRDTTDSFGHGMDKTELPPLPPKRSGKSPKAKSPKVERPAPEMVESLSDEDPAPEAYEMKRTLSKCTVTDSGDVEMESVEPKSPFARAFGFAATFS